MNFAQTLSESHQNQFFLSQIWSIFRKKLTLQSFKSFLIKNLGIMGHGIQIWNFAHYQILENIHCVKSVPIQSYSGPHFPVFGLNTERYGVSLRVQYE